MSAPTKPHSPTFKPEPHSAANEPKHPAARPKHVALQQLTGAQAVIRSLEELGVDVIFGIPGGAVLPVYDPLFDSKKLRHVLVRHEQGAGHAASGYAHVTGRVGVCMATSGPGATNLVTPLADAQMDSIPVVAITGQVGRGLIGTDASRRPTSRASRCRSPSTTFWSAPVTTFRGCWPRPSTSRPPAVRARCWSTSPRTCCRASARSAGRRGWSCPATSPTPNRTAGRSARPPS